MTQSRKSAHSRCWLAKIGNPPYSVGQSSGNDNNANLKYPTLDASIAATYAQASTAGLKRNLYDSYIRAIRWASKRIISSEGGGVVAFVTNGGYIDANNADGLRKTLTSEFHQIYVFNLRGNQRTSGEESRREGGKVFNSGSRATVAILMLVKKPGPVNECQLNYWDIGDYLTRSEKLEIVAGASLETIPWASVPPNQNGDWINHRNDIFESFMPLSSKDGAAGVLRTHSIGVSTSRDAWVYNSSREKLIKNVSATVEFYNDVLRAAEHAATEISWILNVIPAVLAGRQGSPHECAVGRISHLFQRLSVLASTAPSKSRTSTSAQTSTSVWVPCQPSASIQSR